MRVYAKTTKFRRIIWLVDHRQLWDARFKENNVTVYTLAEMMKLEGLYSMKSGDKDVAWAIERMIELIKAKS